ncbi:M13 family metallopeptidase [Alteromonas pelagimontana]|uniref:M13 family metallopeptidase n=1 Tax=Alteromonas pelagimontana TaxID=1858656 RepID=A0A6M4MG22_9ALTE|nr:M13 family metallopeptidase [Alteromonas pelagimontana]QJR81887.1 M13 family metallopeptidase [Alteromonas pelagimontana]
MKYTVLAAVVAASLGLAGCGQSEQAKEQHNSAQTTQSAAEQKPELGTFGVDLSARDESVKPGDDFFMYASGNWYRNYELPADKVRYGAFNALRDRSEAQVKEIIDDIMSREDLNADEQLVHDFFQSYMDTENLNQKGIQPIKDVLNNISSIGNTTDLTKVFGNAWLDGSITPIYAGLWYNRLDPNEYEVSVGVGGLGLPDRDYYLSDQERFKDIREKYLAHIEQMLTLAKVENPADKAKRILALETDIANAQWPREKRRDRDLTLNQIERSELSDRYPNFEWDTFFAQSGLKVPHLNISQPEPVKDVIGIINNADLADWKAYLTYHTISNNADLLSQDIYQANFDFFGTTLNGQQEPRPRWKRAVEKMSDTESLGFALGKIYVDKYFPESSKEQMSELVENLRTALGKRIDNLDWMSEETKKAAQEKLAAFRPKIGYPDEWESLQGVEISSDNLVQNVRNLRKFFQEKSVEDELKPTDRERWGMTPQTVNAYYNSSFNEIVFPSAILQPPFFDPNADPAVNYGAIGAVIGHEMGHGFDDQGSKSDAKGIQRNWWTDEDRAAFEAKVDQLAAQYDAYEPIEGNTVNGRNTLGENIGDVGGLAMAYEAYQISLNGKEAPVIDGLTGDQRFFLAWAQVWKEKRTEQSLLNQLRSDPHSPARYRTLAPRNHDAWYKAFDVQPDDELYLAPEDRVKIW